MNLITGRNAHSILPVALDRLFKLGVKRETRNGPVLQLPGPTIICYESPCERVVFWPERDANPFFHFFESLWMLAGRNDVEFVSRYVKTMAQFSDDGRTFNGAYGNRWRNHFGRDQLRSIAKALRANPACRRQVLSMWDGLLDPGVAEAGGKDVPCNTHAYFAICHEGNLDMTVCNRSNDLVWGALGANAVHFSMLQEWMAAQIGVPVGKYYQMTNNLHGYLKTVEPLRELVLKAGLEDPYTLGEVSAEPIGRLPLPMVETWLLDNSITSCFLLHRVAYPMQRAWHNYQNGNYGTALAACHGIESQDWSLACYEWVRRRQLKAIRKLKAQDDGVAHE